MSGLRAVHSMIHHRALVGAMVRRDLAARYRGSCLGTFWARLSPLALIIIDAVCFGVFLPLRPGGGDGVADVVLFILADIVPRLAVSQALTCCRWSSPPTTSPTGCPARWTRSSPT